MISFTGSNIYTWFSTTNQNNMTQFCIQITLVRIIAYNWCDCVTRNNTLYGFQRNINWSHFLVLNWVLLYVWTFVAERNHLILYYMLNSPWSRATISNPLYSLSNGNLYRNFNCIILPLLSTNLLSYEQIKYWSYTTSDGHCPTRTS